LFLTLTLNPAIDKTVSVDRLVFEDRAYILSSGEEAGGRGLNASRLLHSYGVPTLAIAPSGGDAGGRLRQYLACSGYRFELVPIQRSIRTNLIVTDRQGLTVKLNEPGPQISQEELANLEQAVVSHLEGASWLLLCGSLPPGVPADSYRRLIREAKRLGVRTLVDSDAEVLQDALLDGPTAVTPNQHEAARLLNKGLITRQHIRNAAQRILAMGAESVILSLGSRGALAARDGLIVEAVPPTIDAVCPIGAGDALNAAFAWAMSQSDDFADAVRWAVAAGTASARLPGMAFAPLEPTREIYNKTEIRQIR
jgi:1-phosphofructokinase family hexose kinase